MARRRFKFGAGGAYVPIQRGSDDERREWAAAERLAARAGDVELMVEFDNGQWRNLGTFDLDDYDNLDDLYDYFDDLVGDGDGGYWPGDIVSVSVVAR